MAALRTWALTVWKCATYVCGMEIKAQATIIEMIPVVRLAFSSKRQLEAKASGIA